MTTKELKRIWNSAIAVAVVVATIAVAVVVATIAVAILEQR